MATLATLSARLRSEIGDLSKSFAENFTGDGFTSRFQLSEAPVNGPTVVVKVNGIDVSDNVTIEELTGLLIFDTAPADNAVVLVSGTTYKYFTDDEICYYLQTAFTEHARTTTDSNGTLVTLNTLPAVDEYPLILLASTMALYTLATDASFDIDIISPDGVSIPRSERFRQLSEIIQARKDQYKELCALLGVGLYKTEVYTLRRISRMTNRYVPVYRPQEIDDGSLPQRVILPMPNYGDVTPASTTIKKDFSVHAGDTFVEKVKFSMDLTGYTPLAQIRLYPSIPGSRVGPVIIAAFTITKEASISGGILDTLRLSLPATVTQDFPKVTYYDLQLTAPDGSVRTYLSGKVFTEADVSYPLGPV